MGHTATATPRHTGATPTHTHCRMTKQYAGEINTTVGQFTEATNR